MNEHQRYTIFLARAALLTLIVIIILVVGITSLVNGGSAQPEEDYNGALAPAKLDTRQNSIIPLVNNTEAVQPIDSSADMEQQRSMLAAADIPDWITVDIIPEDCNSRCNYDLEDITGVVVHYVGNPGISAENNRAFFDNEECEVNSHFIVGLEGEIIQCVPLDEQSVASNNRNRDTISIEVCHPDESGKFTETTYKSLTRLVAWLCVLCDLEPEDVIRHHDVNGKECPYYYVHNPESWEQFKADVAAVMYIEYRTSLAA